MHSPHAFILTRDAQEHIPPSLARPPRNAKLLLIKGLSICQNLAFILTKDAQEHIPPSLARPPRNAKFLLIKGLSICQNLSLWDWVGIRSAGLIYLQLVGL